MDRLSSLHALWTHGRFRVVLRPTPCSLPQVCCGGSGLTLQASLHVRPSPVPWVHHTAGPGRPGGVVGGVVADTSSIRGSSDMGTEGSLRKAELSHLLCHSLLLSPLQISLPRRRRLSPHCLPAAELARTRGSGAPHTPPTSQWASPAPPRWGQRQAPLAACSVLELRLCPLAAAYTQEFQLALVWFRS